MEALQAFGFSIAVLVIILGLIGTIVPILPGSLLILLTIVVYAVANSWQEPAIWQLLILIAILLIGGSASLWMPAIGAQKMGGAPRRAVIYGTIGGIIGLFFGLIIGTIVGYALGVFLGCLQEFRDVNRALKASFGSVAGQGGAMLVELGCGLTVLALFCYFVLA